MRAIGQFVVVKKDKGAVRQSKSGLDIPTELNDRFIKGTVVSISEQASSDYNVVDGDEILFDKHSNQTFKSADGEEYNMIRCSDIALVW